MPDYSGESGSPDALKAGDVRALYHELRSLNAQRNSDYQVARDRYNGEHWGDSDNPEPEGRKYTITLNYIRPTVLKTVQLLLGQMPGIQVMPPGVDEEARRLAEREEALLYAVWDKNDADKVFRRIAHNMALLRRGILYYWWDAPGKCFKFRSVAPDNFYPVYDGERIVECVLISRRLTRELKRSYPKLAKDIVPDNQGDDVMDDKNWTRTVNGSLDILNQSDPGAGNMDSQPLTGRTTVLDWYDQYGNWTRVFGLSDTYHTQKLAYGIGEPPVIEFPNALPGDEREPHSEIDDVLDLNLYLDQLISQQANIIKRYSNPTILDKQSGQGAQQIRQAIQADGGVLPIRRDGDIVFLNWQGTPPDIDSQYSRVLNGIYDLSGKPASAYGQLLSNQSGVATNMALSPATLTTEEKQAIFGSGLIKLNEAILRLYEKFMRGEPIEVRGSYAKKPGAKTYTYFEINMRGEDIGGWYKNRIKWPSALRTDDPIFVQNEMNKAKADQSNPPMQSQYTTMENLGIEDVEAEIDRIQRQLEDPRLHPQVMESTVNSAMAMQGSMLPEPMSGLDPGYIGEPGMGMAGAGEMGVDPMAAALEAAGSPAGPKSNAGGGRGGY